jgi:hypothetical protein
MREGEGHKYPHFLEVLVKSFPLPKEKLLVLLSQTAVAALRS